MPVWYFRVHVLVRLLRRESPGGEEGGFRREGGGGGTCPAAHKSQPDWGGHDLMCSNCELLNKAPQTTVQSAKGGGARGGGGGIKAEGVCRSVLPGVRTCLPFAEGILHPWTGGWVVHPVGWGCRGRVQELPEVPSRLITTQSRSRHAQKHPPDDPPPSKTLICAAGRQNARRQPPKS